ncbi:MAG: helix-turn-helix transcriptional regulator [Planctomycetia bacterium]|nr:helix-turn-helix transcriptional regulator [Planctomycetia bacterium]
MLGDELRKARLAARLTQEKLAFHAGLDRTYISHLENDKKSPTLEVLFRLCRAMGISAAELVARVERRQTRGK